MAVIAKEKKPVKNKALKTIGIIIAVIAILVIIGIAVIHFLVRPVNDTSDKAVPVGGILVSDTINYKSEASEGMENNLILKILQLVWINCDASDKKKHESQTPPEVDMTKNIAYIEDGNPYHLLDVYQPKNNKKALPVIIDIHGGGWMYATKDLNEYYCRELASKGYIVFSMSYRLAPDVTVPEQIQDTASALKWISSHLSDYNTNGKVILTGDSAGGMLAAYNTVLAQSSELREKFETVDPALNINALILTSPVPNMKDAGFMGLYTKTLWGKNYKDSELYNYMDFDEIIDFADHMPPTYLITSSGDSLANGQTHKTYELLQAKGIKSEIADFDEVDSQKLPHVFSILDPFSDAGQQAIDGALDFCNKNM